LIRLHERASLWLEAHGDLEGAFQHALATGDEERAAQLIEPHVLTLVGGGQISTTLTWMGRLSADLVLRKPWLCLAEAWVTAYEGWKPGVDKLLTTVTSAMPEMTPALAQRARGTWLQSKSSISQEGCPAR
jgi:ATP/maltotriose-dependent transcriptional regulator MalT